MVSSYLIARVILSGPAPTIEAISSRVYGTVILTEPYSRRMPHSHWYRIIRSMMWYPP